MKKPLGLFFLVILLSLSMVSSAIATDYVLGRGHDHRHDDDDDDDDDDYEFDTNDRVLIVFDDYDGPWNYGRLYANMAANLVAGLGARGYFMESGSYTAGAMDNYDYVLYLGTIYDHPVAPAFLQDVASGLKPVFWLNYNLWQVAWNADYAVDWGFGYGGIMVESDFFSVSYKGESFDRHWMYEEYNIAQLTDPSLAEVKSFMVSEADPSITTPHVIAGNGLWYCVENPLTWLTDASRYLVFADLLAEFMGREPTNEKRAMIRLEDIVPGVADTKMLEEIAKYLKHKKIPFGIGVVPVFKDPEGLYYGYPVETPLSKDKKLVKTLKKMKKKGGTIILHGYTHQYDRSSGDDWEFWIEETNTPVPEDSVEWVQDRIDAALKEMNKKKLKFRPDIWETPHYSGSQLDYGVFYDNFDVGYERTRIFNNFNSNEHQVIATGARGSFVGSSAATQSSIPAPPVYDEFGLPLSWEDICARSFLSAGAEVTGGLSAQAGDEDVYILQYAPYPIAETIYGNAWIPENLGYLEPGITFPDDMANTARKMGVMRAPFASLFYHHDYPIEMLKETVEALLDQGYEFVSTDEVLHDMD
jgi:uncharacterized protein YdaL